jgi:ankyrin repeat protein
MRFLLLIGALLLALPAAAQSPPSAAEVAAYRGLHAAAAQGDAKDIARLIAAGEKVDAVDGNRRTPLHVAAHLGHSAAAQALLKGGANPNALDAQKYDIVTIGAVNNDVPTLKVALAGGCSPKNITSPYQGTALIAAAHLGHAEVVRMLIAAGAPLDHVNNLGWTALIESIVLGNGGKNHIDTPRHAVTPRWRGFWKRRARSSHTAGRSRRRVT